MKPEYLETYRCGGVRVKLYQLPDGKFKAEVFEQYARKPSHVLTGIELGLFNDTWKDAAKAALSFAMGGLCDDDSPCVLFHHDGYVHRETELDIEYNRAGDSYRLRIA